MSLRCLQFPQTVSSSVNENMKYTHTNNIIYLPIMCVIVMYYLSLQVRRINFSLLNEIFKFTF